ncbi:MAG: M56 family metallopeptidase [Clostridia bacterium]|jgi:beta-lactamase regulating signal transducer with metallopeptidase domain
MLSEIFYWVLNLSITGSIAGLILIALRNIKRLPKFAVYVLWAIPLLRLWMPFGIANEYSLLNLISKFTTKTVVVWQKVPEITMTNMLMGADSYFPIVYKTELLHKIFEVATIVWISIAAAAILAAFLLYWFTKIELRYAEHVKDNIYKSDKVVTPAVYGIFKQKIIIPSVLADSDISYIVLHENVHIKRRDNFFRFIAVITACVHWFNPLSWTFLKLFFTDLELACDTKVLKTLDDRQSKEYATTILNYASDKGFFASAFGGAKVRVRIETILSYKKLTLVSSVCCIALFGAIAIILITNAVK